ncbi:MAG TPA: hypothetical protein VGK39_00535 [Cyclobacteriaceae bacterium]
MLSLLVMKIAMSCRHDSQAIATMQPVTLIVQQDTVQGILFDRDILPLLQVKCSPCHFEGGKMYQRMPFDNPKTIEGHREGVVKRFKEPELHKIKAYLDLSKK